MCLSGDVTNLTKEQWKPIDEGMAFYKKIAPIIKSGFTHRVGPKLTSERHLKGWQGVVRVGDNGEAYVLIHTFRGEYPEYIEITLPEGCPTNIADVYSDTEVEVSVENGVLRYKTSDEMKAMAVRLN